MLQVLVRKSYISLLKPLVVFWVWRKFNKNNVEYITIKQVRKKYFNRLTSEEQFSLVSKWLKELK